MGTLGSTWRFGRRAGWVALAAVVVALPAPLVRAAGHETGAAAGQEAEAAPVPEAEAATAPTPRRADPLPVANGRDRPLVILYGDSLAWEARDYFRFTLAAAGADVEVRTMGGTAICDFLETMRIEAGERQPDAVVVEFSGNALTPCMRGERVALGGIEIADAYRVDAAEVVRTFPSARVYFAGAPEGRQQGEGHDFRGGFVNTVYEEVVARHPSARYVDAGASVLDDDGRWTRTLPCLPEEPCTGGTDPSGQGVNVVRSPDGGHFCPSGRAEVRRGVTEPCSVFSSGALRYGTAMANAVAADL